MPRQAKTHLVAFADGEFRKRPKGFLASARRAGVFDTLSVYSAATLPEAFRAAHMDFIRANPRGFGYWIWKPVVILEALKRADPDDCVVYLDAGSTVNRRGGDRFRQYLEMTRDSEHRMLSFEMHYQEARWTKQDCASRLGVDPSSPHMMSGQLTAAFLILQPTAGNVGLVKEWADIAVENDYHYSTDAPSERENHPGFREHRHDQSIGSLLRKLRGTALAPQDMVPPKGWRERFGNRSAAWITHRRV